MSASFFNYDTLIQDAFRGIIKKVLAQVSQNGLPGDHHFYITYRTDYPDVALPAYLKEKHAEEITIVLQHQFWNLDVHDDYFDVSLSFNNKQETLRVPYAALISFFDPSVKFGLQFTPEPIPETPEPKPTGPKPKTKKTSSKKDKEATKIKHEGSNVVTLDAFRKK